MTAGCWALGYVAARFWADWSAPALLTFAAVEIQDLLETIPDRRSGLVAAASACVLLLLSMPADAQQRWSLNTGRPFLSRSNPTHAPWLPEPGGIVYDADMGVFYSLFFRKKGTTPWLRLRENLDESQMNFDTGQFPDGRYELKAWGVDEQRKNVSAYGVFSHRHAAEIEQELGMAVTFVPHLLPIDPTLNW